MADDETPRHAADSVPLHERPALALIDRFLIPVLTAALALIATFVGATLANEGALRAQREQIGEDRGATDRDRRAETYIAFLDASTDYAYAVDEAFRCGAEQVQVDAADVEARLRAACDPQFQAVITARSDFQRARNLVFYYGSQAAEDAAGLLAGSLPAAVGLFDGRQFVPVDFADFTRRYQDFNVVVCQDVQTDETRRCE